MPVHVPALTLQPYVALYIATVKKPHRCSPSIIAATNTVVRVQAVMTNSIFVHDIEVPVPLEEFFVPIRDEVRHVAYRNARAGCVSSLCGVRMNCSLEGVSRTGREVMESCQECSWSPSA